MDTFEFTILRWHCIELTPDQQQSSASGIDASVLPGMLRRRAGQLDRLIAHAAGKVCSTELDSGVPIVVASEHGEIQRAVPLLNAMAENTEMSPTQFSLSVHNAAAGLLSIATSNTASSSSISSVHGNNAMNALFEAYLSSLQQLSPVLLLIAEEAIPAAFSSFVEPYSPYCLALVIDAQGSKAGTDSLSVAARLLPPLTAQASKDDGYSDWQMIEAFLEGNQTEITIGHESKSRLNLRVY